jgi:hypothetical protein
MSSFPFPPLEERPLTSLPATGIQTRRRRPTSHKGRPQRRHRQAQHGRQGGRRCHLPAATEDGAQDDAEGSGDQVQHHPKYRRGL